MKPTLTEEDFAAAAREIGCSPAAIRAVCHVESPKGAFNPDGTLTTLFEAHQFHKFTNGRYAATHPHLSSPKWNRALYGRDWVAERARLAEAGKLDAIAAIKATSWGRFQIMGFNHKRAGHADGADMVNAFSTGEPAQLQGFVRFILSDPRLAEAIRGLDWARFAELYNGEGYKANRYDEKMAAAFGRFSTTGTALA